MWRNGSQWSTNDCILSVVLSAIVRLQYQKTFRYLWRFYSLLFRGFFVAFPWLFRGPLLSRKTVFGPFSWLFRGFFVAFSWLFRGPRFGQNLRVLALEQSSDNSSCEETFRTCFKCGRRDKACNRTPCRFHPFSSHCWRNPNGYQNNRVPKCQLFKTQRTCHFDYYPFWYPFGCC